MPRPLLEEAAASLDVPMGLLPLVPDLFAGMFALGSSPDAIVRMVRPHVAPGARALDLGCGKGAVGLALAVRQGLEVLGVDAIQALVDEANRRAEKREITARCRFVCADLRSALDGPDDQDLVLLVGVGPVLGDARATVGALRQRVRHGGLMLIDDAFRASGMMNMGPEYEAYASYAETMRRLLSHGDVLVDESVPPARRVAREQARLVRALARRARALARRHPDQAEALLDFAVMQQRRAADDAVTLRYATWLLRRS